MVINANTQNQIASPKKLPSIKLIYTLTIEIRIKHIIKALLFIVFLQRGGIGTTIYNILL